MKKITKEELLNLAALSKLHLSQEEIPSLLDQIESILSYSQCVQQIAEEAGSAHAMTKNTNILRADIAQPTDSAPIIARAPEHEENFFVVPVIIEK